jgi:iron complex outermembrane recepter protein
MPLFLFAFFLLFPFFLEAQENEKCNLSLFGTIIDEHDNAPLEFATVFIEELEKGVITDQNGNYRIDNLCEGKYTIKINHIGCEPIVSKIIIKGNTHRNFFPEHHTELLKSVEIVSKKTGDYGTAIKTELNGNELHEIKGMSLGDALTKLSGVNSLHTGASVSKPIVQGLHSNRLLILNNEVRQEGQQWGQDHAPEIDPFTAGNITLIKGANSVRYGSDAIGGVILIQPRPFRDSAGINGILNAVGATNGKQGTLSGLIEGNFKKAPPFSWRLQGTLKKGGNIKSPHYFQNNTGLKENNFSYALCWKKENYGTEWYYSQFNSDVAILKGAHIGNTSDLLDAFNSPQPLYPSGFTYTIASPFQRIEHELIKSKSYLKTGNIGVLNLLLSRQFNKRQEFDAHSSSEPEMHPDLLLKITTLNWELNWEHHLFKELEGNVGMSNILQTNTFEGRYFIPNFNNHTFGIYVIERLIKRKFDLELGIRYDDKNQKVYQWEGNQIKLTTQEFRNVSSSLGTILKLSKGNNVSFNLGSAWRSPSINEMFSYGLHHGAASFEIGELDLKVEKAYKAILNLDNSIGDRIKTDISIYYNRINNFIFLSPTLSPTLTIKGAFPTFKYLQTDAGMSGLDASTTFTLNTNFLIVYKASFLRALDLRTKQWLIMMPSDKHQTDFTFYFDLGPFKKNYITSSLLFLDKQTRVPINSDFVAPPSSYLLLHLESGFKIPFHKTYLEFGFGVRNILNTTYRDYLDRFRYFTDAMGRNFTFRLMVPFNSSLNN